MRASHWFGTLTFLAATACGRDIEKPRAPDMSPLVAAYATPDADFDERTSAALPESVLATLKIVDALDALRDTVLELQATISPEGEPAAAAVDIGGFSVEADGYFRIDRRCNGWSDESRREDPGRQAFTVGFSEVGIDPVVWGDSVGCRETILGGQVLLDGSLRIHVGQKEQVLVAIEAHVERDQEVILDGGLDFQVCLPASTTCPAGRIEVLVPTPDDRHLVYFVDAGRLTAGFRAANGTFDCAIEDDELVCARQAR
jgi:hypothetical protein